MTLHARLAELSARAKFGMTLGLDRVRSALAEVGDPHLGLAVAHVTGSNGKGSTSAMIESIARAAGLKTGLYTSPHLARFAERIRIGGAPIEDAPFEDALTKALRVAGGDLTFFEVLTVAALLAFRDARVDLAVLEVGLGGRLDATNVVPAPLACAITSISLEHTAVLGDTIDAIAREKAGILKPHVPYVLGRLPLEAERAIEEVARAVNAGPRWDRPLSPTKSALRGEHQRWNAAVASAVAELLAARWPSIHGAIARGLAEVTWPGRYERIATERSVTVLFDGAHNDEGAAALERALEEDGVDPARTTLVFGALADKSFTSMLQRIAPRAHRRIYTAPKGRAPATFEALTAIAPGEIAPEPADAIAIALEKAAPGDTVLVTGSLYLIGEVRAHLLGLPADPIIPL
ncbi:MAG: folylpolyglutamate synthase/dihydrofolate synthase family protein [Polyangiaceae bacterium]